MGKLLLRLGILYGVAAYSAPVAAQGDTYLMRHMDYGKTVKPYSPSRPSNRGKQLEILAADSSIIPPGELPVYKPSRSNAVGDGPALIIKYPVRAVRNGLQGDIVVKFAVAPDGNC